MEGLRAKPDWVVIGINRGSQGVWLYASTELTSSELRVKTRADRLRLDDWFRRSETDRTITLSVDMKTFVVVHAPDYASAWEFLFTQWRPRSRDELGNEVLVGEPKSGEIEIKAIGGRHVEAD